VRTLSKEEKKPRLKRVNLLIALGIILIFIVAPIGWYTWHYETAARTYCTLLASRTLEANMGDWSIKRFDVNVTYVDSGQSGVLTYAHGASDGSIYVYVYSTKFAPIVLMYYVDKGVGAGDDITFNYVQNPSVPISIYVTNSPNPHVDSLGNCTP
jgi:hypothetical protein